MNTIYVTPEQAAEELGIPVASLRYMMLHGLINIGDAYRRPGSTRGCYRVVRSLLEEEKKRRGIYEQHD